jgi:hypothetical protein
MIELLSNYLPLFKSQFTLYQIAFGVIMYHIGKQVNKSQMYNSYTKLFLKMRDNITLIASGVSYRGRAIECVGETVASITTQLEDIEGEISEIKEQVDTCYNILTHPVAK